MGKKQKSHSIQDNIIVAQYLLDRCDSLINRCDKMIKDHKGLSKNPNRVTVPMIRVVLGFDPKGKEDVHNWKGQYSGGGTTVLITNKSTRETKSMPTGDVMAKLGMMWNAQPQGNPYINGGQPIPMGTQQQIRYTAETAANVINALANIINTLAKVRSDVKEASGTIQDITNEAKGFSRKFKNNFDNLANFINKKANQYQQGQSKQSKANAKGLLPLMK